MIERVHARIPETVLIGIRVPAFPNGSGAVFDAVQPGGHFILEKEGIGHIPFADLGEDGQDDIDAEEADRKGVFRIIRTDGKALVADIGQQIVNHRFFLCLVFVESQLECPQQAGLCVVRGGVAVRRDGKIVCRGGENGSILLNILVKERLLCLLKESIVFVHRQLVADDAAHFRHQLGGIGAVTGIEELVRGSLEGEPVAEFSCVVALFPDQIHVGVHLVVILADEACVASLMIEGPGDDNPSIAPARCDQVCQKAQIPGWHDAVIRPAVVLVVHVHDLGVVFEEGHDIKVVQRRLGKQLGITRPAGSLCPLRAVGRD